MYKINNICLFCTYHIFWWNIFHVGYGRYQYVRAVFYLFCTVHCVDSVFFRGECAWMLFRHSEEMWWREVLLQMVRDDNKNSISAASSIISEQEVSRDDQKILGLFRKSGRLSFSLVFQDGTSISRKRAHVGGYAIGSYLCCFFKKSVA